MSNRRAVAVCRVCGEHFVPRPHEQLCSDECRRQSNNAANRRYQRANPDKRRAAVARYMAQPDVRERRLAQKRAAMKAHRIANIERYKAKDRAYAAANAAKRAASNRLWREANRDALKEKARTYNSRPDIKARKRTLGRKNYAARIAAMTAEQRAARRRRAAEYARRRRSSPDVAVRHYQANQDWQRRQRNRLTDEQWSAIAIAASKTKRKPKRKSK